MSRTIEIGPPSIHDFVALQESILDISTHPDAEVQGNDTLLKVKASCLAAEGILDPEIADICDITCSFTGILRFLGSTERLSLISKEGYLQPLSLTKSRAAHLSWHQYLGVA